MLTIKNPWHIEIYTYIFIVQVTAAFEWKQGQENFGPTLYDSLCRCDGGGGDDCNFPVENLIHQIIKQVQWECKHTIKYRYPV